MTRNRFDPARFVLGLALLTISGLLLFRALGDLDVPYLVLVSLVPVALLFSGLVAAGDRLIRPRRRRTAVSGSGE